jgi:Ca2+/Na+ antiporter
MNETERTLKQIKDIIKSKPIFNKVAIILLIIYLLLITLGVNHIEALKIFLILMLCTIIIMFLSYQYVKRENVIDLEKISKSKEIKELEIKEKLEERTNEILKNYDPNIFRFFKVLERNGIESIENIEKKLMMAKEKVFFIIESGEKPPKQKKTFFTMYIENVLSKTDTYEIFRIRIYGTNSFIVFSKEENNEIDITKIYNDYYNYIEKQIKDTQDFEVKEWYKELRIRNEPLILITQPYAIPLSILINMLPKRLKKDDVKRIMERINSILKEEIEISKIKFSYLLEAVGFDDQILTDFESIESKLIKKLKETYKINKSINYFSELLSKKDFLHNFESTIKELDEDFYKKISNDQRFDELKTLIKNIQTKIFGVQI